MRKTKLFDYIKHPNISLRLIRGTPIVVQVMFLYFALPVLADFRIDPMSAVIFAIVVNAGAYIAEIVRGTFLSISKGLTEAGLAIGMTQWKVLENIALGPRKVRGASKAESLQQAQALLDKVGLSDKGEHYPSELSGGQQQREAIARALAVKPKVMLFDEPTSALDPELKQEVLQVMLELAKEGMTMVVVTHEMSFAKQVGTCLIFMEHCQIAVDDDPRKVIDTPANERMKDFLSHVE